ATRALRFDFGQSFLYNRPVGTLVRQAAANTALLAIVALALATVAGIPLGILTGSRQGGVVPALVRGASLLCLSLPPLLTSLVLVFVAARTGWLPTGGMTSVAAVDLSWGAWMADVAWHLLLPALALALPIAATFERLQAQAMRETIAEPFVMSALARGVPRRQLLLSHAWRASLRSICAVYGLAIGALLSGSFIVEYIAAWPGLGRLMYEALRARDIYLVAGCAAMGGVFLAIGSLIGDLLLAAADPRVTQGETA
ncbi:MAG: ABC transporter permease, partial [Vicinamibacterales bacterium]